LRFLPPVFFYSKLELFIRLIFSSLKISENFYQITGYAVKTTPVFGSPTLVSSETGGGRNLVIFEDKPINNYINCLVESFALIWLFIGVSLKITKLRSSRVLASYLKQGLVFTVFRRGD